MLARSHARLSSLMVMCMLSVGKKNDESKQSADHSHTVVDSLRTRLKDATQEFKQVLTLRTESLKAHHDRRKLFGSAPDTGLSQLRPPKRTTDGPGRSAADLFSSPNLGSQQQQQQLALQQQDSYMSSRAEALHNVESTIVELGSIFQQLAHMVAEQGEMAQRIDENLEETMTNVDSAKAQLLKYFNSISNNRWLFLKVFSVLTVFLILFIFLM